MTKAKKSKKAKRVRASFDATSEAVIERRANDEAKQVQEIENELRTEIEEEVREQIENERGEEHSRLVAPEWAKAWAWVQNIAWPRS